MNTPRSRDLNLPVDLRSDTLTKPTLEMLDPGRVRTNFVVFRVERDRESFIDAVAARRVLVVAYPHGQVRAVTHYGIGEGEIEVAIAAIRAALEETAGLAETASRPAASVAG